MKAKELKLEINNKTYKVKINKFSAEEAVVTVNDKEYTVSLEDLGIESAVDQKPKRRKRPRPAASPDKGAKKPKSVASKQVKAPLPGLILEINVDVGDEVEAGQEVLILEAMKMENDVQSNFSGVVKEINVKEGDSVEEGKVLITLD